MATRLHPVSLAAGVAGGLISGVVLALVGQRVLRRRAPDNNETRHFIDGTHEASAVELATRPPEEATTRTLHLESEAVDVSPNTQRW